VGRTSLPDLLKELESRFGGWKPAAVPKGSKDFTAAIPARAERIVLVDRPQSPQSLILAGQVLSQVGSDDLEALLAGNDVLGGNFLSRINMDLRETKGWSMA
jgi:predicted Zn-dependent peptidase